MRGAQPGPHEPLSPAVPRDVQGSWGGGLCSGVTLPLPPELHQDLSASLLLAGHHGQRGRGHLEAGRRHRPAQGAQVRPDGRWGQGEGGLGVRRGPPPKPCRSPPPPDTAPGTGTSPTGGSRRIAPWCAWTARGSTTPAPVSSPGCARGSPERAGGGHLEGLCVPPPQVPVTAPEPIATPALQPRSTAAHRFGPQHRSLRARFGVGGALGGGPRGIINGCTE